MTTIEPPRKVRFRAIFAGAGGNLVEWFDWYTYSATALYFADDIFPAGDAVAGMLQAAAIFAVGFLIRPLGGWLMGRYADRHGRRAALTLSVLLMSFGSLMIACMPTYRMIGALAPVMLLLARMLQGFSLGGEYGASATYLSEIAPRGHRGFVASFHAVTLIMGQVLALAVLLALQFFILPAGALDDWGWRIPFVIGALAALSVLWMRRNMEETPQYVAAAGHLDRGRIRALLKYPKSLAIVAGLTMGGTVAFYTYTTYMQKFLVLTAGLTKLQASLISATTITGYMILQPVIGALSDRIGRRPILLAFGALGTLLTVPLLETVSHTTDPLAATLLIFGALVIVSGYSAINPIVKAELFPAHIRALGVGLPFAITVSLFGGTAEFIALWFKQAGLEQGFYWYVTGCIAVSFLVYLLMPETRTDTEL